MTKQTPGRVGLDGPDDEVVGGVAFDVACGYRVAAVVTGVIAMDGEVGLAIAAAQSTARQGAGVPPPVAMPAIGAYGGA